MKIMHEIFGCKVTSSELHSIQAAHDISTLENTIDELHQDYSYREGREILADERERIQAAAEKLSALLNKIGTEPLARPDGGMRQHGLTSSTEEPVRAGGPCGRDRHQFTDAAE